MQIEADRWILVMTTTVLNLSHGSPHPTPNETTSAPFPLLLSVAFGTGSGLVSVATVLGNILVLLAFLVERNIRVASNYFIASLALTDLIIGAFSMNLFTAYTLYGYWPLPQWFCSVWLFLDYTACLTSQYTVLFITVDRFCSVKAPAKYRQWRKNQRVVAILVGTWVLPAALFLLFIMGWPLFVPRDHQHGGMTRIHTQCYAEFTTHAIFNTIFTLCYFWITLIVMCILYAGIYQVAWKLHQKSNAKRRRTTALMAMAGQTISGIGMGVSWANTATGLTSNNPTAGTGATVAPLDPSHPSVVTTHINYHVHPHSNYLSEKPNSQPLNVGSGTVLVHSSIVSEKTSSGMTTEDPPPLRDSSSSASWFFPGAEHDLSAPPEDYIYFRYIDDTSRDVTIDSLLSVHARILHVLPSSPQHMKKCYCLDQGLETVTQDGSAHPSLLDPSWDSSQNAPLLNISTAALLNKRTEDSQKNPTGAHATVSCREIEHENRRPHVSPSPSKPSWGRPARLFFKSPRSGTLSTSLLRRHANNQSRGKNSSFRQESSDAQHMKSENRAWKALRTISIILGAFVACWTPYHILVLVKGFCDDTVTGSSCVNDHLYNISYWLCYLNSPINPFCYAFANAQFKKTFIRILKGNLELK